MRPCSSRHPAPPRPQSRLKRVTALLLLCVALLELIPAPPAAAGGLTDALDDFLSDWESQLIVTEPGFYEGQKRGYLFGGAARLRAPVMNITPLTLQLPKITAGCGGISAFGGSFSFINMDRFTEYLQAIAQNAIGMAFDMALTTLCPQCAATLHKLEDIIQKVNALSSNSCQAAKQLLAMAGATPEAVNSFRRERCADINNALGNVSDWFGGSFKCSNNGVAVWEANRDAKQAAPDPNTPEAPQPIESNIFWDAWMKFAQSIEVADFDQTGENLMSLYGTIVLYFEADKTQHMEVKPPLLETRKLLEGWQGTIQKGWICGDDHTRCLKVDEGTLPEYKGLVTIVEEKITEYATDLEAGTRSNLGNNFYLRSPVAGVPLYRLLVNTASIPGANDYIIQKGARWIALELLDSFTKQASRHLHAQILKMDDKGQRKIYLEAFSYRREEIERELSEQRRRISQDLADLKHLVDMANGSGGRVTTDFIRQLLFAKTIQQNTSLVGR